MPADKVLYGRGVENIEHGDYPAARLTLNTLINMLREGDAHALAQAEAEYRDFIRFYPDMKEAAELQVGEPLRKIREHEAATPR